MTASDYELTATMTLTFLLIGIACSIAATIYGTNPPLTEMFFTTITLTIAGLSLGYFTDTVNNQQHNQP